MAELILHSGLGAILILVAVLSIKDIARALTNFVVDREWI